MKKSYLMIAAAVAMFTACQETDTFREINTQQENKAIGFKTFTTKQTRAENSGETNYNALEAYNTTFRVWGNKYINKGQKDDQQNIVYEVTPVFGGTDFAGEKVEYKTTPVSDLIGNWDYDPIRFWDKTATKYDFYAASPFIPKNASGDDVIWQFKNTNKTISLGSFTVSGINRVTTGTNGEAALSVTTSLDKAAVMSYNQEDLMIATDIPEYTDYAYSTYTTGVNLQFNHVLSRLNVAIRKKSPDLDAYTVKLNSFEINNMYNNGDFNEERLTTETDLQAGTIARWQNRTTRFAPGDMKFIQDEALVISSTSATPGASYQYIYEGLVIPQNIGYSKTILVNESITGLDSYLYIDGSNVANSGDAISNPYVVIDYEIWTKAIDAVPYTTEELAALNAGKEETDPDYLQEGAIKTPAVPEKKIDGYKYYFNLAEMFGATTNAGIDFCEGWQNTIKITLAPEAIKFDAEVAKWDEKFGENENENPKTGTTVNIQ